MLFSIMNAEVPPMFKKMMTSFSSFIFDNYYAVNYLENVTKDDWKITFPHETSALIGFNPETLGNEVPFSEQENAVFRFIWNKFDHILYVTLERYQQEDRQIFPSIYADLLAFLKKNQFDCLVTVFGDIELSSIPDMLEGLPFSYTGIHSKRVYATLATIPMFKEQTPVLHIGFDGIQYNDWHAISYKFNVNMLTGVVSVLSNTGQEVAILSCVEEAETFATQYL